MNAAGQVGIGIIGAGNISSQYLRALPGFGGLDIVGIADMRPEAAAARAAEFGIACTEVATLLAEPRVDIVLNLTIPRAHVEVGLAAVAAGKHVYGEKPLGTDFAEARRLLEAARARGVRIGSAPDTFLGGSHQQARQVVDSGALGRVVGGTAVFACPGHEYWHPDPAFYYDAGGGPVLDMGPYYITDLVNLLGPVARVQALSLTPFAERPVRSEPRRGEMMKVRVATHVTGTLVFASGALVTVMLSFDVPAHGHPPLELYGTEASLRVPDPNMFGGEVLLARPRAGWEPVPVTLPYADANHRSLGLAEMAAAIRAGRPHRCSGELALHVLEVMEAFGTASREERLVDITTPVTRPAPLGDALD